MKQAVILSLLATIPLAGSLALADPGCEHGPRHGGWHDPAARFERRLDELGLEPKQKEKVQAILEASKKKGEDNRAKLHQGYEDLHGLLEQDSPDQAAVDRQVEKIGVMKTEAQKAMLRTLLAVRAELTPEQRKKLKEMKRDHGPRHGRDKDREGGPEGEE